MQAWGLDSGTKELTVDASGNGGSEPFKQGGSKRQKRQLWGQGRQEEGIIVEGKALETQQVIHQSS